MAIGADDARSFFISDESKTFPLSLFIESCDIVDLLVSKQDDSFKF